MNPQFGNTADRRRGGIQVGRSNDSTPRGWGQGGRNNQQSNRGARLAASNGRGKGYGQGGNHGGHGTGRGGAANNFKLSKPAPSCFPWTTDVPESDHAALLDSIRGLVQHPAMLMFRKTYLNASHLLRSREQAYSSRRCKSCYASVSEAEFPESVRCHMTPDGQHNFQVFKKEDNGKFFASVADPSAPKRAFVVLDAEFIQVWKDKDRIGSENVVGKIAVIDGLTGEVLINHFVMPEGPSLLKSLNLRYSGIERGDVDRAYARGGVINDLSGLGAEMAKYIDENTIIAGHALYNDLLAAKFSHDIIIDTQLLFENTCSNQYPALKKCMAGLLGHEVQKEKTHDALEDACATRELILLKAGWIKKAATPAMADSSQSSGQANGAFHGPGTHQCRPVFITASASVGASTQNAFVTQKMGSLNISGGGSATIIGAVNIIGSVNSTVTVPRSYASVLQSKR